MAEYRISEATGFRVHPDDALNNVDSHMVPELVAYLQISNMTQDQLSELKEKL